MTNIRYLNLKKRADLLEETLQLIEKSFQYSNENKFKVDFAPLMEEKNLNNCHVLLLDEKIIGHIGIRMVSFGTRSKQFPLAMLGGICIHPNFRGRGFFKPFFERIINLYKDQASLFVLWSEKEMFYKKFGFHQAGGQIVATRKQRPQTKMGGESVLALAATEGPFHFSELSDVDFSQLAMLYDDFTKNKWAVQRDDESWNSLRQIESCDIYFVPDKSSPQGYLVAGKGQDLTDITHEVIFFDDLPINLDEILPTDTAWISEGLMDGDVSLYTGFFKIGNIDLFTAMIKGLSDEQIAIDSVTEENVIFIFNSKTYEATHEEFLRYFFGPQPLEDFSSFIKPLIITGLDSI